jgi:hypothetical protein
MPDSFSTPYSAGQETVAADGGVLRSFELLVKLMKAYRALRILAGPSETSHKEPLAQMYIRNKIDQYSIELDSALWADWRADADLQVNGSRHASHLMFKLWDINAPFTKQGQMASDKNTIFKALMSTIQSDYELRMVAGDVTSPASLPFFEQFLVDKFTKFYLDVERIEGEQTRVNQYIDTYVDTRINRAEEEMTVDAADPQIGPDFLPESETTFGVSINAPVPDADEVDYAANTLDGEVDETNYPISGLYNNDV